MKAIKLQQQVDICVKWIGKVELSLLNRFLGAIRDYHQAIESEPATSNWISVKDSLPEENSRVLVIESDGHIEIAQYRKERVFSYSNRVNGTDYLVFMSEQDEQPYELTPTHYHLIPLFHD
jgi:hypothetical protein